MKHFAFLLVFLLVSSCTEKQEDFEPFYGLSPKSTVSVLRFGVHPLHNPDRLNEVFGPLIKYLNKNISEAQFQLEASVNYAAYEDKIKRRELEFALPNPYQTLMALKSGYRIFAKMGDDQNFRGIILVRKDSGIREISQLRGKSISYPAPTALAATMLPQYFLFENGLNVLNEATNLYVGSQDSSIMNVFLKNTDAGCSWPPPWESFKLANPDKAEKLEVRWQTKSLPNNGLVVRNDIPDALVKKVLGLLIDLNKSEEGRKILKGMTLSQFEVATEHTYDPVKIFMDRFTKHLRKPEKEK